MTSKQAFHPHLNLPRQRLCRNTVMVREPHHERYYLIVNASTYPFVLSPSKGEHPIATQPLKGEEKLIGEQGSRPHFASPCRRGFPPPTEETMNR